MDEAELERLYALALALVPETNAAGDLFMLARDEADLRRRAAAWCRRHGLPPPEQPLLPALNGEQRFHALHLAHRGKIRRRLRPWLGVALAAAVVLAALGARSLLPGAGALGADPAYAAAPAESAPLNGLQFSLYRTEATPVNITAWWSVSGPGAALAARDLRPQAFDYNYQRFIDPTAREVTAVDSNLLRGRTTYAVTQLGWKTAVLRSSERGSVLRAPLVPGRDPQAHTLLRHQVSAADGYTFTLTQITLAPRYTVVRYQVAVPAQAVPSHWPELQWEGGGLLRPLTVHSEDHDRVIAGEALFLALPPGIKQVSVRWSAWAPLGRVLDYSLDQPGELRHWERDGSTVFAGFHLADRESFSGIASFIDAGGDAWRVDSASFNKESDGWLVWVVANGVPSSARLLSLRVNVSDPLPLPPVQVTLGAP